MHSTIHVCDDTVLRIRPTITGDHVTVVEKPTTAPEPRPAQAARRALLLEEIAFCARTARHYLEQFCRDDSDGSDTGEPSAVAGLVLRIAVLATAVAA